MPKTLRVGYQLDPTSHLGPLVSQEQLATVERYVALGQQAGATLVTGGHRVEAAGITGGYYYSPTILADVDNKTARCAGGDLWAGCLRHEIR